MNAIARDLHLSRAKLKATSGTSALLAGFAIVAMVETQLDKDNPPCLGVLVAFSVVTTLLVIVHMFALMISTCLLPNLDMAANIRHEDAYKLSPHISMKSYIEIAWVLSTGIGLGLFLIELGLLIWLKFLSLDSSTEDPTATPESKAQLVWVPSIVAMVILVPASLLFAVFACRFYTKLADHRLQIMKDTMKRHIDPLDDTDRQKSTSLYPRRYFLSESSLERCPTPECAMPVIEEVFESASDISSMVYNTIKPEDIIQFHGQGAFR